MTGKDDKMENQNAEMPIDESKKPDVSQDTSEKKAIEDHAKVLKISASVFAAVKQSMNWAAEKKVTQDEFEKAVKDFLGSPVGGIASKGDA